MAEDAPDISQLSPSEQEALDTYLAVTNSEPSVAIPLLQRSQWNVNIAIAKFFDGETPDPVEEARAAAAASPPSDERRREVLIDGSTSFPRSPRGSPREPAPRIVPQPESRSIYKPPFLLSLILSPVNLLIRLLSGSLNMLGLVFPPIMRLLNWFRVRRPRRGLTKNTTGRRSLNPKDTASRFFREFEEEYGTHGLNFFENGYAQAYDTAKKDLKYLLVILISPEHDDTDSFVRETLLTPDFEAFANDPQNNLILWVGTVQDSEAYQVSIALGCTQFPFAGLICHTPQDSTTAMSTVARVSGQQKTPSAFIAKLRSAMDAQSAALERVRAQRAEQQASRTLRQEQNSAYERSLAQDRERMRLRREAEAQRKKEEEEAQERARVKERAAQRLMQWRRWKARQLPAEPEGAGADGKPPCRLSIRMPSGERVVRKFAAGASIQELYDFVECHGLNEAEPDSTDLEPPEGYDHEYKFNLVSPMPRAVYALAEGGSIGEKVGRSANLIVEPILGDDDEDDEE